MPVGLSITNDSGKIQIDENYPVLSLRHRGTVTATAVHPSSDATGNGTLTYIDVAFTADMPLVAINGALSYGVIAVTRVSTTSWTFRIGVYRAAGVSNSAFTYFVFDRPQPIASGGYGLGVYGSDGKLVFSSLAQPCVVDSIVPYGYGNTYAQGVVTSSRDYAVCFNGEVRLTETIEEDEYGAITYWSYDFVGCSVKVNPSNSAQKLIAIGSTIIAQGSVSGSGGAPYAPTGDLGSYGSASSALVIDVTDYL